MEAGQRDLGTQIRAIKVKLFNFYDFIGYFAARRHIDIIVRPAAFARHGARGFILVAITIDLTAQRGGDFRLVQPMSISR